MQYLIPARSRIPAFFIRCYIAFEPTITDRDAKLLTLARLVKEGRRIELGQSVDQLRVNGVAYGVEALEWL